MSQTVKRILQKELRALCKVFRQEVYNILTVLG